MKVYPVFFLIIVVGLFSCHNDSKDQEIDKLLSDYNKKTDEWNDSYNNLRKLLIDSGKFEGKVKTGYWVEYSNIMKSNQFSKADYIAGKTVPDLINNFIVEKEIGLYKEGLREGLWTHYTSIANEPFCWTKSMQTYYESGKRNGDQFVFSPDGDTLLIVPFVKDSVEGIVKVFELKSPHRLLEIYNIKNKKEDLFFQYDTVGNQSYYFRDTIINNEGLRAFKAYFENGQVASQGYYNSNGDLHLSYKMYHSNGCPWTERIYQNGDIVNVLYNSNKYGKKLNKGSLINGSGSLNIYNEEDSLVGTIQFLNGKEIITESNVHANKH